MRFAFPGQFSWLCHEEEFLGPVQLCSATGPTTNSLPVEVQQMRGLLTLMEGALLCNGYLHTGSSGLLLLNYKLQLTAGVRYLNTMRIMATQDHDFSLTQGEDSLVPDPPHPTLHYVTRCFLPPHPCGIHPPVRGSFES